MNLTKIVLLLSIVSFVIPASSFAQRRKLPKKTKEYSRQVKLSLFLDRDTTNGGLVFGTLAPAFVNRNKNGFWHTLELNRIIWNTEENIIGVTENRGAAIRHQFDVPLGPRWNMLQATLGTSEWISYQRVTFEPTVTDLFLTKSHRVQGRIGIIPALHVYPVDRIDIGLGALFGVFEWDFYSNRSNNPTIPSGPGRSEDLQTNTYLPRFQSLVLSAAIQF